MPMYSAAPSVTFWPAHRQPQNGYARRQLAYSLQPRLACICRSARATLCKASKTEEEEEWKGLLAAIMSECGPPPERLAALVATRRAQITTRFIAWVGDQGGSSTQIEVHDVDMLCGRLLALCDRADTLPSAASIALSAAAAALPPPPASEPLSAAPAEGNRADGGDGADHSAAGAPPGAEAAEGQPEAGAALAADGGAGLVRMLSARWAALSLRGEGGAALQRGVNAEARERSAAALMGRVGLPAGRASAGGSAEWGSAEGGSAEGGSAEAGAEWEAAERAAAQPRAEERILAVLLGGMTARERADMLEEALTPPPESGGDGQMGGEGEVDGDDEMLFTTPLRLLQAVDSAAARLAGGGAGSSATDTGGALGRLQALLPSEKGGEGDVSDDVSIREALLQLRELLLARVANETGST